MGESADKSIPMGVRIKLSAMMFLQFMLVAVFWQQLSPFLEWINKEGLGKMADWQMALILSAMPIGCLFSPIVGMVADRYFAGQKVLCGLNLFGGILLLVAAFQTNPTILFVLLLLFMICYMPTWGLTSAISMANSPAEKFPQIRVFGSIGWVFSIVFSLFAKYVLGVSIDKVAIGGMNIPMLIGGIASLAGAAIALTVPNTPPLAKGKPFSIVDALGLRTFALMKDFNFALFVIVSVVVMLPFGMDWTYFGSFLKDKGYDLVTAVTYTGRAFEIGFMLFLPYVLARMGVKWAMCVGLVALIAKVGAYMGGDLLNVMPLVWGGIWVHGLVYGFFFVGGQIYINRKAPKEIQAQAQGFIFLITFGVGLLVANFINKPLIRALKTDETVGGAAMKDWTTIWLVMTVVSAAALVVFFLFFWDKPKAEEEKAEAEKSEA
ncbi:MAG: MFS transporter [Planctomycetota bacterium]|jgi:nucleoside transporter